MHLAEVGVLAAGEGPAQRPVLHAARHSDTKITRRRRAVNGAIGLFVPRTVLTGQRPAMASARRNELIHRLLAGRCELCEDTVNLEVHQVRKLADLNKPGRREKPRGCT